MKSVQMGVMAAVVVGVVGLGSTAGAEKAMQIADGMKVTLEYTMTLPDRTIGDSTAGQAPFSYTQGNQEIVPGLEKALAGMKAGDKKRVTIPAAAAYGPYDEKGKVEVPKKNLPPEAKVGTKLRASNGAEAKVVELKGDVVIVDTNHPLAGKDLTFDVNIIKVETPPKAAKPAKP
ncbi:MAG: FKBP-type peptidyl-prolyl cis-trans isomerase [Nitrospirales bacterium]|nr:FKBP-type peptidyl-prolyl cis-trans isomerase [Nitrospirales bacterium]